MQPKKTRVSIWVEMEGENPEGFTGETEETGQSEPSDTIQVETGYNPDFNP